MSAGEVGLGKGAVFRFGRRVNANADLDSLTPRFAVEAREAIKAHLAALFAQEPASENALISRSDAPPPEPIPANASFPMPTLLPTNLEETELEELAADNVVVLQEVS